MPRENGGHDLYDGRGHSIAVEDSLPPKAMLRRSSLSLASLTSAEPSAASSSSMSPGLVAGDQTARPHFLKDRSMTMRDRLASSSSTPPFPSATQSRASSFLVRLVEKSRSSVPFESKPPVVSPPATADAGPQRRRQSIVLSESALARLGPQRTTIPSIRSGSTAVHSVQEDPEDPAFLAELLARSLPQLVQDLSLYRTRADALRRVLHELRRRLETADPSTLVSLCRELVDGGLLPGVVLAMREFRFHAALQTAAIALLSLLADVSDLYAFEMAELDVAPLVHKAVAVHVSDERLVMAGSSLARTIAESRHKRHVLQMHRERLREKERERAASLVEAFAAVERRVSKAKTAGDERPPSRLPSRRQRRSTIEAVLGAPPVLTAQYDLEVSAMAPRASLLAPLPRSSEPETEQLRLEPFVRPKTSPDLRSLAAQTSVAKTIAVYSQSQAFVAPSPLEARIQEARKTHSATTSTRRTTSRRRFREEATARPRPSGRGAKEGFPPLPSKQVTDHIDHMGEELAEPPPLRQQNAKWDGGEPQADADSKLQPGDGGDAGSDGDPVYDDDEFDPEDGDNESEHLEPLALNSERLLPVGSDSDLFDLVDQPESDRQLPVEGSEGASSSEGIASPPLSELALRANEMPQGTAATTGLGHEDDPVTAELVGLLNSCIDSSNPTSSIQDAGFLLSPATNSEPKKPKKIAPSARSSPVVSSWTPPNTIVRPVSRRIMDKTEKKSIRKKATPSRKLKAHADQSNAQITPILEQIQSPEDGKEGQNNDATDQSTVGVVRSPPTTSTPTTSISQIQALYARGLQHHKANELDEAVRCYEQGIHLQHSRGVDREFASPYINLGSARLAQQRPYDALVAYTQAERVQPHNTKALFNTGLVLMQLTQLNEAIGKFEQVITLDDTHVRAKSLLEQCRKAVSEGTPLQRAGK